MNAIALNKSFVLDRVLRKDPPPFALVHRPGRGVQVLAGEVEEVARLADVPLSAGERARGPQVLVLVPFRQVAERGFTAVPDDAPLLALRVRAHDELPLGEVLRRLPDGRVDVDGGRFDLDDEQYAATVRAVIDDEIGRGEGANFVIRRTWSAEIVGYTPRAALTLFRRLCERESGAYWTFVVHTGGRTFVGASPERHVSLEAGTAVMNPISGTYRYPPGGATLDGLLDFLADGKERDELYMVVDEELKMMARVCTGRVRMIGPRLREMARLAHTEYLIEGECELDPREVLRETLFAPTVTGSPLESACRVIARHEPRGRGYYSGVAAIIGRDDKGRWAMDSAILIRTAEITAAGRLSIGVGATVVRHSDPASEAAETTAKVAGLLGALNAAPAAPLAEHPQVLAALAGRNAGLAPFWLAGGATEREPRLAGRTVLVLDAQDTFTAMIDHQLRALGLDVTVRHCEAPPPAGGFDAYDLVVAGPGPGDPLDRADPRIARLHEVVAQLLAGRHRFVAVCLSHQVLSHALGLPLARCKHSNQGRQRTIDLFGEAETVGLYNSFAARCEHDKIDPPGSGPVEVSRDPGTGEVFALRGPHFASMQFHAESVLTVAGPRILAARIKEVLNV
ncbi:anthranilate synthase family protein [Dactylosporangium sp. CA-139066]|uniref:anthranilate synthase family protein n=1 Tax=Dactylosporangium sp. CA-139066 TaxID=3239930 RepID=UPI003D8CC45B